MAIYLEKSSRVDAIQLTKTNIREAYEFIHGEGSVKLKSAVDMARWSEYEDIVCKHGMRLKISDRCQTEAVLDDFIVKKSNGFIYVLKPDLFENRFERV